MPNHSIEHGRTHGPTHGPVRGSGGIPGVTRDSSGKYIPQSAGEWTALMAAAGLATGNPSSLWKMQEASGDLADSVGSLTFTATGSPLYQQSVSGWSSKAVALVEAGPSFFSTTPVLAGVSFLGIFYVVTGTPSTARVVVEHPDLYAELNAVPQYRSNGGSLVTGSVTVPAGAHALALSYNSGGGAEGVYWEGEKIQSAIVTFGNAPVRLGHEAGGGAPMSVLYGAAFTGTAAELTPTQIKALLTTLGWTVAWS